MLATARLRALAVALLTALVTVLALVVPAGAAHALDGDAVPLDRAHAHNDYLHRRPLLDALAHGFTSVEADVWLVGDELCLGHASPDCRRTLESAYLAPLEQRVAARGGSVYEGWGGTFQLVIDVKSDGVTTWPAVERALAAHPTLMTRWRDDVRTPGPVVAVVSGKRSLYQIGSATERWSAYDGTLSDLGRGLSPELMPMVSASWWDTFSWRGGYPIPAAQRARLQGYADQARAGGYALRFYATPDLEDPATRAKRRAVWDAETAAGVRWLNTDHLAALETYLRAR